MLQQYEVIQTILNNSIILLKFKNEVLIGKYKVTLQYVYKIAIACSWHISF